MNEIQLWWAGAQDVAMSICWIALGFFFHAYLCRTKALNRAEKIVKQAKKQAEAILNEAEKKAKALNS